MVSSHNEEVTYEVSHVFYEAIDVAKQSTDIGTEPYRPNGMLKEILV